MANYDFEREQLKEIMRGSRLYVKRLYRIGAFGMADVMRRVDVLAQRLTDRRDLLLPAYKRQVADLQYRYMRACQQAEDLHPGITRRRSIKAPVPPASPRPSRSRLVHMTLPEDQWQLVDMYIAQGLAKSRADYFRRLHYEKST
jgi:hypothetical protein